MSLNSVYSQRYTPTPRSKAMDTINAIIHQQEEGVRHTRVSDQVDKWRRILGGLHPDQFIGRSRADAINQHLRQSNFPPIGIVPSEMALVEYRADQVKNPLTIGLLRALRTIEQDLPLCGCPW